MSQPVLHTSAPSFAIEMRQRRHEFFIKLHDALQGDVLNEYTPSDLGEFAESQGMTFDELRSTVAFGVDAGWLDVSGTLTRTGLQTTRLTAVGILYIEERLFGMDH